MPPRQQRKYTPPTPLRTSATSLPSRVLSDPSQYPDEFKAWLPRFLNQNVNLQLQEVQTPSPDATRLVGSADEAPFQNSWVNYGGSNDVACYYRDPFGRVHLSGVVKSGTMNTPIFTLPKGHWPQYPQTFAVASNDAFGVCIVGADGTVVPHIGSNVYFSLCGITFRRYS